MTHRKQKLQEAIQRLLLVGSTVMAGGMATTVPAACDDGCHAYQGHRFGKDPKTLRTLAIQGEPRAQTELAALYRNGIGVQADAYVAYEWYRKAAENGDSEAQFRLGLMYLNGEVITPDEYAALDWLERAANQEHPKAEIVYEQVLNAEMTFDC